MSYHRLNGVVCPRCKDQDTLIKDNRQYFIMCESCLGRFNNEDF